MIQLFIGHSSRNDTETLALSQRRTHLGCDKQLLHLGPQRGVTAGECQERASYQAVGRRDAGLFVFSFEWPATEWCLSLASIEAKREYVSRAAKILKHNLESENATCAEEIALKLTMEGAHAQAVLDWANERLPGL